jgi:hypothetical protein
LRVSFSERFLRLWLLIYLLNGLLS